MLRLSTSAPVPDLLRRGHETHSLDIGDQWISLRQLVTAMWKMRPCGCALRTTHCGALRLGRLCLHSGNLHGGASDATGLSGEACGCAARAPMWIFLLAALGTSAALNADRCRSLTLAADLVDVRILIIDSILKFLQNQICQYSQYVCLL